jgi:alanine racemase
MSVEAHVDLTAIAHNVVVLQHRSGAPVLAVVKADGYGHGAVPVAHAALRAGAAEIGVATVAEALVLRDGGVTGPVIAWLHTPGTDFTAAIRADVEVVVSSTRQLSAVVAAAEALDRTATVGVKIDTGLGRSGAAPDEWAGLRDGLARQVAAGAIRLRTAMTHLACGDEPAHPLNDVQAQRFDAAVAELGRAGIAPEVTHISNSAAALTRPDLSRDLVRAGIAVYGSTPMPGMGEFGLRPAMELTAEIAQIKRVVAGQGVSYNQTWAAPRGTTVAVVACGYADGVPRVASNRFTVWHDGRRFPNVGRVCMDQFVIDLGPDGSGIGEGDRVVLFGDGAHGKPTAHEWAELAGTIDYEILTAVRGRRVRRYLSEACESAARGPAGLVACGVQ